MKRSTERVALKPPVKLFAAKSKLAKRLIELFPLHDIYVEHFGGSAALLLSKESSPLLRSP